MNFHLVAVAPGRFAIRGAIKPPDTIRDAIQIGWIALGVDDFDRGKIRKRMGDLLGVGRQTTISYAGLGDGRWIRYRFCGRGDGDCGPATFALGGSPGIGIGDAERFTATCTSKLNHK